jgi:hypothetical protein
MNSAFRGGLFAAALATSYQAFAHAPRPLVPTALVEDVKSASAKVEFMDYVGSGQVIELAPGDILVLSYLKSCEHETITGGTVRVGLEKSEVQGGKVSRRKVRRQHETQQPGGQRHRGVILPLAECDLRTDGICAASGRRDPQDTPR